MKGKIVLVPFPFTDLTATKLIPALVIYDGEKDAIIVFISSHFKKTGLKTDSVIKLDKIATALKDLIVGELGEPDEEMRQEVNQKLKKHCEYK